MVGTADLVSVINPIETTEHVGHRCHVEARGPSLRKPTVAIMIDGVLANISQYVIDQHALQGLPPFMGASNWRDVEGNLAGLHCTNCYGCAPYNSQNPETSVALQIMKHNSWSWLNINPFNDVDFSSMHEQMDGGDYLGYFLANRFSLDSSDMCADPRYLTRSWLKKQNGGKFDAFSIVADICWSKIPDALVNIGADYFLSDSFEDVTLASARGITSYLINRPYNYGIQYRLRVDTVAEFLEKTVYAK